MPETNNTPSTGSEKPNKEKVYYFLVAAAAIVVLIAGIRAASDIVGPILLALFLTIVLLVPLRWLQKKGVPNMLAILIVGGSTVVVFLCLGYFVGKSMNDLSKRIPSYRNRIIRKVEDLEKKIEQFGFSLGMEHADFVSTNADQVDESSPSEPRTGGKTAEADISENESVRKERDSAFLAPLESVREEAAKEDGGPENESEDAEDNADFQKLLQAKNMEKPSLIALDAKSVMYWVSWSLVELRHLLEGGFLVMIFTIFMIFEASRFPEKVDRAFGKEGPISNKHLHQIAEDIRRYLFLKTISSLMSALAATFVYWIFGVPAMIFWGIVAFFLYFIPNVGGTLAAIIPGLLIFMTFDIQGVVLYAMCLIAIECAIAYGIEPKMLGHGLGIATVVIILSLVFWGWILGPIGLFLAAPLTIMVKIILQAFKETEWVAILLSDKAR